MFDNRKVFRFLFLCFIPLFLLFTSCAKKKNSKLAQTYYKMAMLELGELQDGERAYKKSLEYIDKALEQENKPDYLAFKATLLFKLAKEQEGLECFDKALQLAPPPQVRAETLNNMACLLADIGLQKNEQQKIKRALKICQELQEDKVYLTPEVSLFNQSKVYLAQKEYNVAKQKLLKAVGLAPNYLDAHYYLSLLAYELKDLALAKNATEAVLFLEPEHKGAKQLKEILQK